MRRRLFKAFKRAPLAMQVIVALACLFTLWLALNWTYQVVRKPSELFFPVSGTLYKTPAQTWASYAPIFTKHSTRTITPDFLAALAQVEGSGNPVVRTYWRWSFSRKPFEVYRPASERSSQRRKAPARAYPMRFGPFVRFREQHEDHKQHAEKQKYADGQAGHGEVLTGEIVKHPDRERGSGEYDKRRKLRPRSRSI